MGHARSLVPGRRRGGGRAVLISVVSTTAVFGLLAIVVVNAPNWPEIQRSFFDPERFADSMGDVVPAFLKNVQLALIAEGLVLVFALVIAVMRSLQGPAFLPIRILATIYVDLFRAIPGVLIIFALGFGVPALGIPLVPKEPFFWAVVTLTLLYSAYVSEVYRAGIESVHPSQAAAARSLGLSQWQALRFVVLPQAVRRVVPPLLNDFIGLQKDTVLVSFIGVVEIFRTAQIKQSASFNFTPYVAVAVVFILVTIPLARLTDWLVTREGSRGLAVTGGATRQGNLT
jgi:polar amino acid transport system permease protein